MFDGSHGLFRNRFDVADSRAIIPERTKGKFNLLNEFKQDGHHYQSPLDRQEEEQREKDDSRYDSHYVMKSYRNLEKPHK